MPREEFLKLHVECYAGYQADERPVRFSIGDRSFEVQEVLDRWYEPQDTYFKVRAEDGNDYILKHCHPGQEDFWLLAAYRKN